MRFILSSILGWAFNWFLGRIAAYLWEPFTGMNWSTCPTPWTRMWTCLMQRNTSPADAGAIPVGA
jgi:hypothetical protein